MKLHSTLIPEDVHLIETRLKDFIPHEIFDAHAHLAHPDHFTKNPIPWQHGALLDHKAYAAAMSRWLPGHKVNGLFFGFPRPQGDLPAINAWMAAETKKIGDKSRTLLLVTPDDDPSKTAEIVKKQGFVGLKVYHVYAKRKDTMECGIEEFAPEWTWDLCNSCDGILMLHIVLPTALADKRNQEAILRLCRKYPRCRLVLAHVSRSFNYRNGLDGLPYLAELDNVWVDTSAIAEMESMRRAIEVLGPGRVMYGSDYPVTEFRGRCVSMGEGFVWLYGDDLQGAGKFGEFTLVGIESLLCLREACEACALTTGEVNGIFRNNALRLLAPHLPKSARPETFSGPELWSSAKKKISGGTSLISKRAELFDPKTWPSYFSRCSGSDVWDMNGKRYTDFAGGVGAVVLGYSDPDVNAAVKRRLNLGSYCNFVTPDEMELADLLLELNPWAGKVRYARGGGDAMGIAVRIARAATGKSGVAFCGYHGWHDWYLAANLGDNSSLDGHLMPGLQPLGVPRELQGTSVPFKYNDLASFDAAMKKLDGRLAAVVMEPMRSQFPKDGFIETIAKRCRAAGGVFVIDEITSGWRYGFPGAMTKLGIEPDVVGYAKAMSNGIPCAAVVARTEIMDASNPSFISSSYWTDGIGPAAALACIRKMRALGAQEYVWKTGEYLQKGLKSLSQKHPSCKFTVGAMPCAPSLAFDLGKDAPSAKALMVRKLLERGFVVSTQMYVMMAHTRPKVDAFLEAMDASLGEIGKLAEAGTLQSEAGTAAAAGFTRLA